MEGNAAPSGFSDDQILLATKQFIDVQTKVKEQLTAAGDELLSGSAGTIYLKRMGHRSLSAEDSQRIIKALGTDEDRKALVTFEGPQQAITQRMKKAKAKGLILTQASITLPGWRKRVVDYTLWKPDQIIQVIEVLKRMRV